MERLTQFRVVVFILHYRSGRYHSGHHPAWKYPQPEINGMISFIIPQNVYMNELRAFSTLFAGGVCLITLI
jgi:hypothetical protein